MIVAVGHAEGHGLVQYFDRGRQFYILAFNRRHGFDNGRKIRPGVTKYPVDPTRLERAQKCFSNGTRRFGHVFSRPD